MNLLPALLDLLEQVTPTARLDRLIPPGGRAFALPLGDGRYVTVPPERLRILVKVLDELYQGPPGGQKAAARAGGAFRFPAAKAGSLGGIDAAFAEPGRPAVTWTGATALHDRGRALAAGPGGSPRAPQPPVGLRATLRPYQQEGLRWLQHLRAHGAGGVLADDMGLGKTLQTIAHLVAEKEAGRLDAPALIVAPTSVVGNWRRELGRFAPALRVQLVRGAERRYKWADVWQGRGHGDVRCDVALTTYAVLVRDEPLLASRTFSTLILDEAQAIKNPRSQAHQAAARIQAAPPAVSVGHAGREQPGRAVGAVRVPQPGPARRRRLVPPPLRPPDRARQRPRAPARAARSGGAVHPPPHQGGGRARSAAQDRDRPPGRARAARSAISTRACASPPTTRSGELIASKGIGPATIPILDALDALAPGLLRSRACCAARPPARCATRPSTTS